MTSRQEERIYEEKYTRARQQSAKIGPLIPGRKRARLHARCSDDINENCNDLPDVSISRGRPRHIPRAFPMIHKPIE